MDFVDTTVLRLADPAARPAVFDAVALEQLVGAGYDVDTLGVEGPFQPVFDEVRLGLPAVPARVVEGVWNVIGGVDRTELRLRLPGLARDAAGRVDAVWRGSIVARAVRGTGTVSAVSTDWPDRVASTVTGTVTVEFAPAAGTAVPVPLPVTAVLLVRDAGFSVAALVAETNDLRDQLGALGLERPAEPGLPARTPVLLTWVVPPEVFDDPGWPGGAGGTATEQRASRRAAAGGLLAREGIGLVVPGPP